MTKVKPRERILDTAAKLFVRDGFHATGIDTIVAEAEVAKMTLYKHFESKDTLILEVLRRGDEQWRARFESTVEKMAKTPEKKLLALFDALQDWFEDEDFYGCTFINASAEYSAQKEDNKVLDVAEEHNNLVGEYIHSLAAKAKIKDPAKLTKQISILMEGAIVCAVIHGQAEVAQEAKEAAKVLIQEQLNHKAI